MNTVTGVPIPQQVQQRAVERWIPGPNGCHISIYSTQSRGYAQIGWQGDDGRGHGTTAHRAAWIYVHGPFDAALEVDHRDKCDRRCVNVDHLRLLPRSDNRRRNISDFPLGAGCVRGHDPACRRPYRKGHHVYMLCGECRREQNRESKARVKARHG